MTPYILVTYLPVAAISLALAMLILLGGSKTKATFLFFLALLSISFWVFCLMLGDSSKSRDVATFWINTAMIGPVINFACLYFLLIQFLGIRHQKTRGFLVAAIALPFFIFCYTTYNVKSISIHDWGAAVEPGLLYYYFLVYFGALVALSIVDLRRFKTLDSDTKSIIKIAGTGIAIGACFGIVTNLGLILFGISQGSILGPISALIISVFVFFSMLKSDLTGVKFIIPRYFATTIVFTLILFTIVSSFFLPAADYMSLLLLCGWAVFLGKNWCSFSAKATDICRKKISKRPLQCPGNRARYLKRSGHGTITIGGLRYYHRSFHGTPRIAC